MLGLSQVLLAVLDHLSLDVAEMCREYPSMRCHVVETLPLQQREQQEGENEEGPVPPQAQQDISNSVRFVAFDYRFQSPPPWLSLPPFTATPMQTHESAPSMYNPIAIGVEPLLYVVRKCQREIIVLTNSGNPSSPSPSSSSSSSSPLPSFSSVVSRLLVERATQHELSNSALLLSTVKRALKGC